jgi:hypothetical protein
MTDREFFRETFDRLHASQDTVSEVLNMAHKEKRAAHKSRRAVKIAALAAAAAAVLMTTAFGLGRYLEAVLTRSEEPSEIAQAVLTKADISGEKPAMFDSAGNAIDMPDMERVPTDEDTALKLTGGYLYDMDAALTLDSGVTVAFDSFIMDAQGMGIVTYTVSDPGGVSWSDAGYGAIYSIYGMVDPQLTVDGGGDCDSHIYLINDESSDTEIHVAQYFGVTGEYEPGESLLFTVPGNENAALRITPEALAPVTELSDNQGHELALSPFGLRIGWHGDDEMVADEITVRYADGADYTVVSGSVLNSSLSYWQTAGTGYDYLCEIFNRLVDVESVESVTVTGHTYGDDGNSEAMEFTFTH